MKEIIVTINDSYFVKLSDIVMECEEYEGDIDFLMEALYAIFKERGSIEKSNEVWTISTADSHVCSRIVESLMCNYFMRQIFWKESNNLGVHVFLRQVPFSFTSGKYKTLKFLSEFYKGE